MDPRYQWPPQGYGGGQYAPPPQSNGYPPNGYPMQYPQQAMPQQYPQSQPPPGHPQVVIPPRPSQQYAQPMHDEIRVQPRTAQPQVVMPRNTNQNPLARMNNPRIRQVQVQVPVQRSAQVQRASSDGTQRHASHAQPRPQQPQTPASKPVQKSQSFQENVPRPQQRTPSLPTANQNQHRAPLQPQSIPKPHTPSSQPSSQHRSPGLPHASSSQSRPHPQVVIKKTSHSVHAQAKTTHTPTKALPADLTVLLLQAADEYVNAARGMGSVAAMAQREADLQQYYKLMATGLGCMEAVLKKYNQQPRDEAKLRLGYASLLVEETDNDVEIEEVLSKGIALCQRNHLLDLKYSMQHLQARYQFQSNHRAALKSLDGPTSESETFQHIVWVYAFRFLKVSLALRVPGRPETASALQQLHAIVKHAEKRGDRAIFVTACALEAMIHLRTSSPEHLENAQRAIAAARSYQLEASTKHLGQIAALVDSIDIACSLQQGRPDIQKMMALQQKADQDPGPANGVFSVLIEKSFGGQSLTQSTGGIFTKAEDGRDELVFSWLPKNDLKMLAYYLSGMTALPNDMSRGINYLQEGFRITQDSLQRPAKYQSSIPTAIAQKNWMATLDWHLRFTLGLTACRADDLPHAKQALVGLRKRLHQPPFQNSDTFSRLAAYLSGVIDQSNGFLDSALATYALSEFSLPESGAHSDFKTDVAIIATMNRILILRNPAHPEHYLAGVLFSQLEPLCNGHSNLYIDAAFRIIRALTTGDSAISRHKTLTHNALSTSQKLQNFQFITVCLSYMTSRFFADTVGEQAVKSVRAARSVAKQSRSVLWRAVAYGLCINTFQRNGLLQDAADCQNTFEELWDRLPEPLKAEIQVSAAAGTQYVGGDFMIGGNQDVYMQG